MSEDFAGVFEALTEGKAPFRWQSRLYERFAAGDLPDACDIPTGLGKTAVMAIWLIALAEQARADAVTLPRRLVYVVDRRTVVDQSTDVAEAIRKAIKEERVPSLADGLRRLAGDPKNLLAISTLRGEFADNKEWQDDPARAAIIVGTVDMIGSRLLFSGYGVSRKMRPFHAGLIGQDTLIVHDEAHLSPAFGKLIKDIAALQGAAREPRPLRVMELSATQRDGAAGDIFALLDSEKEDGLVKQRLQASKSLRWHDGEIDGKLAETLADAAVRYEDAKARVIVYVRSPKTAMEIAGLLQKKGIAASQIATLTGTIRGHERDQMTSATRIGEIKDEAARQRASVFQGFRAARNRIRPEKTQYLVATSAGEVGIDLDADHMVSDLSTLDSMIQRLGRVNRLGEGAAEIVVVIAPPQEGDDDEALSDIERRIAATETALQALPEIDGGHDANPQALRNLVDGMASEQREACFSKMPTMVELTDILLDGWAMTSVEDLPGRPPVARWLHGVEASQPSLHVAWREEIGEVTNAGNAALNTLFDKHPILAQERLRGNLRDVVEELKKIARRLDRKVVLIPTKGDPEAVALNDLLKKDSEDRLRDATIVLPRDTGGLDSQGMLDGSEKSSVIDVADRSAQPQDVREGSQTSSDPERLRIVVGRDPETEEWSARRIDTDNALELGSDATATVKASRVISAVRRSLKGFAEKERIILYADDDTGQPGRILLLLSKQTSLDLFEENPAAAAGREALEVHLTAVHDEVKRIATQIGRIHPVQAEQIAEAIIIAALWHDRGKNRDPWQADIGNPRLRAPEAAWECLAKSGRRGFVSRLSGKYRHEFGSLREASADGVIAKHPECDLILHLIASHHGWARPHFREEHGDIADDVGFGENESLAAKAARRFARLQRRFGHWGLAWLESLLRAADYRASRNIAAGTSEP